MQTYKVQNIRREPGEIKIEALRIEDQYKKTFYIMGIDGLKRYATAQGNHFFDPSSMRFFNSRIGAYDLVSGLFISSEKGPDNVRKYTIRKLDYETGNVDTIGKFQQYSTLAQAKRAFKTLVGKEVAHV